MTGWWSWSCSVSLLYNWLIRAGECRLSGFFCPADCLNDAMVFFGIGGCRASLSDKLMKNFSKNFRISNVRKSGRNVRCLRKICKKVNEKICRNEKGPYLCIRNRKKQCSFSGTLC